MNRRYVEIHSSSEEISVELEPFILASVAVEMLEKSDDL